MATERKKDTAEKKKPAEKRKPAEKPIELEDGDLAQVSGGIIAGTNLREDPCAGGEIKRR